MMGDIEDGKIGILLVKDLSRLGRNNATVSYLTEIFFPQRGVRLIAVNDGIDSFYGENELMGFKSLVNEQYSRDISKKIRASFRVRAQKGEFIGSFPPYGYLKDPADNHHLIVDEYAAGIVERMFALSAEGTPAMTIGKILSREGILTPMAYLNRRTGKWKNSFNERFPAVWSRVSVYTILKNRVYMGHMVGCKQTVKSFKNKTLENVPEENWITVRGTHTAIVDEATFWHVQELLSVKRPANVRAMENIFVGKLKCADCGKNLGFLNTQGRHQGCFVCNSYRRNAKSCSAHYIRYDSLYSLVQNDLRRKIESAGRVEEDMNVLTTQSISNFIDHIVVHEHEGSGKPRTQKVEIYYRFSCDGC